MIKFQTPTGTDFNFSFDFKSEKITITSGSSFSFNYHINAVKDLYDWLKIEKKGEWIILGTKGEEETASQDTVEAWARNEKNPNCGFYGLTPGRKG